MPSSERSFSLVRTSDQWLRCTHSNTALDAEQGVLELAALEPRAPGVDRVEREVPSPTAGGLAFDGACQAYRSLPEAGHIESAPWSSGVAGAVAAPSVALFGADRPSLGEFKRAEAPSGPLASPRALAVDTEQRLFVAEAGKNRVLVYDLIERRLARVLRLADEQVNGPRPVDLGLAPDGRLLVLTEMPTRLFVMDAQRVLGERPLEAAAGMPTRLAVSATGRLALLDAVAGHIFLPDAGKILRVPGHASDLEFDGDSSLVVAFGRSQHFRRLSIDGPESTRAQLRARGYDGRGIARAPSGGIAFWSDRGPRLAIAERRRYEASGTVTTFRLDSGTWQSTWGRLLVDACVPEGSQLRAFCAAADEPPEEPPVAHVLPRNATGVTVPFPALSPPLPPASFTPVGREEYQPLHRRDRSEVAWSETTADDRFVTLEAPVQQRPEAGTTAPLLRGRYLWVTLLLLGDGRVTPRVRCLRVEHQAHDYLRRIPRAYSVDASMESFLHRYLGMFASLLVDLDDRSALRDVLLAPAAAPDEALGWLASFLGLVLDERWASAPRSGGQVVDARRLLIAEASSLFRVRGTLTGLSRFIELYTGVAPIVFEQFRARGVGGASLGEGSSSMASGVVGSGLYVGGTLGKVRGGVDGRLEGAFDAQAHRFSVLLPGTLTDEQLDVVAHIVELHRPAHTLVEIFTRGPGMRLGLGLHLGISSIVGNGGRFTTARLGQAALGGGTIVGRPGAGTALGSARLDGGVRLA